MVLNFKTKGQPFHVLSWANYAAMEVLATQFTEQDYSKECLFFVSHVPKKDNQYEKFFRVDVRLFGDLQKTLADYNVVIEVDGCWQTVGSKITELDVARQPAEKTVGFSS